MQTPESSNQEVQVVETTPVAAQPAQTNLVLLAMEKGFDVSMIEKMMDLQERNDKREAEKAYVAAMAEFKADPPKIVKEKLVSFNTTKGKTEYMHATLGQVTSAINSGLGMHGLSASWKTKQNGSMVSVTCRITHKLGHFDETELEAAADNSGGKNSIQAIGSSVTYLQRYTLLALTGLATHDQDDDGKGSEPVEYLSDEQISNVVAMLDEKNISHDHMLNWLKCEKWETVPAFRYEALVKETKKAQAR